MPRLLLATLALLAAGPVLAAETPAPALPPPTPAPGVLLDRVVALVNDGIVTQSELDDNIAQVVSRMRQQNIQLPPEDVLRRQVLDRLVMDKIQSQRAERIGIKVSDEMLGAQLTQLAQANGITLAQLPEALAREGINYASFREDMREDIARQMLRRREVLNQVNITPRELDQFMERLKRLPDERAEYNFSHILIALPSDATQEQNAEVTARAQEVYERAVNGEDFAQLAIAYSNSQTALEGGLMGWRRGAELPTLLAETIASLRPGQVARPIAATNGMHIVRLNDMRSADGDPVQQQIHARHILLTPNALQDDATVRQRLEDIRKRVLAGEEFAAFASSMSEDTGSAVEGGDLGWLGQGATVPEFEAQMNRLQDGEISEPFQTQFGWHIVQVLERREFDTTEEMLRERAFRQLQESKADQNMEIWLRRLRDESYVETDIS